MKWMDFDIWRSVHQEEVVFKTKAMAGVEERNPLYNRVRDVKEGAWVSDVKYTRDEAYEGGERSLQLARRKPFEVSEGSV